MDPLLGMLRAAGDPTRLRLLLLLAKAELTVSEITDIIGQSQPRISRHLKLLCDAGLLERIKEGAWVFYRGSERGEAAQLTRLLSQLASVEHDPELKGDAGRLKQVREERARQAASYFAANAAQWEKIRALHVPESEVETAITRLLQRAPLDTVLDAGTGTARILELLSPHIRRGIGIDSSPEMLTIARDRLANAGITNCQVRRGDVYRLPFGDGSAREGFGAVIFHQVLHFLDDPLAAIGEAARVLRWGGRILIADFAPHDLEFLRSDFAHRRLGFSDTEVEGWFRSAGLKAIASENFAPPRDQSLSVVVWLGERVAATQISTTEAAA
ncbi:MAG TPA: metalloregulator ArsR/SmtB family transcription factor [Micropepsaceae bacterium]|nr:metalloregulator ArsR/SmtB family transcription factor [Micropepsaceae bacterium]